MLWIAFVYATWLGVCWFIYRLVEALNSDITAKYIVRHNTDGEPYYEHYRRRGPVWALPDPAFLERD